MQHPLAGGDQTVADVELRIPAHVSHRNTVAVDLILDAGLRAAEFLGLHRQIVVVLRAHTVRINILRRHSQRRQVAVKREIVHSIVQQAVADRVVAESVTVRVVLDHLHADTVIAGLAPLAAQVNLQNAVVKLIQEVRAVPVRRYPVRRPAGLRMATVRHREVAMVGNLAYTPVDIVRALLQQLVVDVHRYSVLLILVAPRIHLHADAVVPLRSQTLHIRNQLPVRQNRILDVEYRHIVGKPRYHLHLRMLRQVADITVRSHHRIVVLPETVRDAVEARLLEQDVNLRAGVQSAQADQVAPARIALHRELARPRVQRVVLQHLTAGRRVQLRNHVHETVVVERQTHIAPVRAIRGVLYHILQVHILPAVLPAAPLHQVEPVVRALRVVYNRVRVHVWVQHQERQLPLHHARRELADHIICHRHTVIIAAQAVNHLIQTGGIPRGRGNHRRIQQSHQHRAVGYRALAFGNRPVADAEIRILGHIVQQHTVAVNLIFNVGNLPFKTVSI